MNTGQIISLSIFAMFAFCMGVSTLEAQDDCPAPKKIIAPTPELIVLIGKKRAIDSFEPIIEQPQNDGPENCQLEVIIMDAAYKAHYRVEKVLSGNYKERNIKFELYTHFGYRQLPQGRNHLLFLVKYPNSIVSFKYLYHEVFKTRDKKWAICGDPYRQWDSPQNRHKNPYADRPAPQALRFSRKPIGKVKDWQREELDYYYPSEFYRIKGDKVYCKGLGYTAQQIVGFERKWSGRFDNMKFEEK